MLSAARLEEILAGYADLRIGLLGDLFLDRYLEIAPGVEEHSIETGLEAYQVERIRNSPGALGTVMNNLASLRVGRMLPLTVIGEDGHGDDLCRALSRLPIDDAFILRRSDRLTPTYTKPLKQDEHGEWRELHRLDVRTRGPLTAAAEGELLHRLPQLLDEVDGLIVLDQINETDWGVVNSTVRAQLSQLARSRVDKFIYVDSRQHIGLFEDVTLKGNRGELLRAGGHEPTETEHIHAVLRALAARNGRAVFCTCGEEGVCVALAGGEILHAPRIAVEGPIDFVGAGDSASAGIVASLLAGADELEAATLGNLVASITIQQLGTTGVATPAQVRESLG